MKKVREKFLEFINKYPLSAICAVVLCIFLSILFTSFYWQGRYDMLADKYVESIEKYNELSREYNKVTQSSETTETTSTETTTVAAPAEPTYSLQIVHEESLPTYTYWDKNDQRVDGSFYMRVVLVTGEINKAQMLKEAEKIESDKGSVETRVKFYSEYDSSLITQPKENLLADIILRNGELVIDDPYEPEPKYISKDDFISGKY